MNVIKENIINAKGKIDYTFTNDFVFRAILQRNKNVLTALICSLLHLPTDEVDVTITNPIELGNAFSDKDFILDIRVEMNDGRLIDLEMQMTNEYNWPERSISYAARTFDSLSAGKDYIEVKPIHSIGFLNFTLFPQAPEFYATYQLMNIKTHQLYSSKFSIYVVDLSRIDLATEEDSEYEIDRWAKLFKASTWEELFMIAKNNPTLMQASNDLYEINADELMRQKARARADAEFWERNKNAKLKKQEEIIEKQKKSLAEQQQAILEQKKSILEQQTLLEEKDEMIRTLQSQLNEQK